MNSMMKNGSMGGMHMTFYFGNDATILFSPWKVATWQGMLWSCVVILVVSFLYEGLKFLRQRLLNCARTRLARPRDRSSEHDDDDELLLSEVSFGRLNRRTIRILLHVTQAILYLLQVLIGYMLMLVAMTYNAWLLISLVLGAGIGYLVFNFRSSIFDDEVEGPCH
jgi:copper transporter 1